MFQLTLSSPESWHHQVSLRNAWWLLLSIVVVGVGCQQMAPPPGVVATTGIGEVTGVELEQYILSLPQARRRPSSGAQLLDWRAQMLERLIVARLLEDEARSKRLAETGEGERLLASRVTPIVVQEMGRRMIAERVVITEADLRSFYDAHPEDFSHPNQIRLRNIYRRVARDAPSIEWEAARGEMEQMLDQIRNGARFGDLARSHSDSETAAAEGLIGRIDRGRLKPALEDVLWELEAGEVSEVIRSATGFHIFKVEDHIGEFVMDFEDARSRLRRRLTREATEVAEKEILAELLAASGARYQPALLQGGDGESVLFELGERSLTVAGFRQQLSVMGFSAARGAPLQEMSDRTAREGLYQWEAERQKLSEEPALTARLKEVEKEVLIALALRERGRAMAGEIVEQDLRDFYESRQQRFRTPRLLRLRLLTRDFPDQGNWYAVYEELHELGASIRAGTRDFAQAARESSTDYSAAEGGDVGSVRADALTDWAGPQAQKAVLNLQPGEISEPILIERYNSNRLTYDRAGYMLVRLESIEEPRTRPFEEVREIVIEQYLEQGGEEVTQWMRDQVLRSGDVEIYVENL